MAISKKITKLLEDFLKHKSKSDGGYAPVADGDEQQLIAIFGEIIRAKYSIDPDGDLPIEAYIVNRHHFYNPHFSLPRYDHKLKGEQLDFEIEKRALNVQTASKLLSDILRNRRFEKREQS